MSYILILLILVLILVIDQPTVLYIHTTCIRTVSVQQTELLPENTS